MSKSVVVPFIGALAVILSYVCIYQYYNSSFLEKSKHPHAAGGFQFENIQTHHRFRNKRATPGTLFCAALQVSGNPTGSLGLCGGYMNSNLSESTVVTPDGFCDAKCHGATCKNDVYCNCPSPNLPSGCYNVTAVYAPLAANVVACQTACHNLENKTAYLCPTTVPQQFSTLYCMCADPSYEPASPTVGRRRRQAQFSIESSSDTLKTLYQRPRRSLLPVVPEVLSYWVQQLLNSLQIILNLLAPVRDLVCSNIIIVNQPFSTVKTCYNVDPSLNGTIPCGDGGPSSLVTPQCLCQKYCPGNSTACAAPGYCLCKEPPVTQCVRPRIGSGGLACEWMCSEGQTPYVCSNSYCICYDPRL